jgi:hypothetical protein
MVFWYGHNLYSEKGNFWQGLLTAENTENAEKNKSITTKDTKITKKKST